MNDNNLQQTLLQQEVTPPNNVWEKIAVALDEADKDAPLKNRLLSTVVTPPSTAWQEIDVLLDDEEKAAALLTKEIEVPFDMWEKISLQMDKEADAEIAAKLVNAAVVPPTVVWETVQQELQQNEQAKIIPLKSNYKKIIRFAAAAAITGLLAWGAFSLLDNNNRNAVVRDESTKQASENKLPAIVKEPATTAPAEQPTASRLNVRRRIKNELKQEQTVAKADVQEHSTSNTISAQTIHHGKPKTATSENGFAENQYFVVLNDNGDLVRVTKRINNMKCMNTEDIPVDAAAALNTRDCNNQIKQWQEKMAMSTSLANASGIIDIAELIKTTDK